MDECKKKQKEIGIIYADFDNYKQFNDKYSHSIGDKLLFKIAEIFKTVIGEKGLVCRYGGDEKIVILPYFNMNKTIRISKKILKS